MTVLVITRSNDNDSVLGVLDAIKARGARTWRFDTDRYPTEVRLTIRCGAGGEQILLDGPDGPLDVADVTAVWYRRIDVGGRLPAGMDPQLRAASVHEARTVIDGFIASIDCFHFDPIATLRAASNKQLQLMRAAALGLETPRTLVTNDPVAARAFAASCPGGVITKMMASFAIGMGADERVVYTNRISEADLADPDGLRYCPMTFQELVAKARELRFTVVGDRVFTAEVDSQAQAGAEIDWRRRGVELLEAWRPYSLPADVEAGVLKLMRQLGLNYGAGDIIVTPEGRHVFLEINPAGEFFWLDKFAGLPIMAAIADILTNPSHRPSSNARQR